MLATLKYQVLDNCYCLHWCLKPKNNIQYDFVLLHCEQQEIIKRCMEVYDKYDPAWFEDISEVERRRIDFNKIIDNTSASIEDVVARIVQ